MANSSKNPKRLDRLDLNHLVVLNALLDECSVSRAAERVFLSQPAASFALARLREFFGDPLLAREGRKMVLTPAAKAMVAPLRDLLRQVDRVIAVRPTFDPATVSRTLRIESSDYLLTELLPHVVAECAQAAPRLVFEFAPLDIHSRDRLDKGELDFVIAPRPWVSPKHPTVSMFRDGYACVTWRGNHNIGESLTRAEFFQAGHVATDWSGGLEGAAKEHMSGKAGDKRRIEVSVAHYSLLPRFLEGTPLIATVQASLARQVAASAPLRVLPCPVKLPVVEEIIQCHRFQEHDPLIAWFTQRLQASVADVPPTKAAAQVH